MALIDQRTYNFLFLLNNLGEDTILSQSSDFSLEDLLNKKSDIKKLENFSYSDIQKNEEVYKKPSVFPKPVSGKSLSINLLDKIDTLEKLRSAVLQFEGCELKELSTNTVFADGNPKSSVFFIGEAPGAEEDRIGLPFVGQSGKLLDKMLEAIGLNRKNSYITNVVNWRPPGNRQPDPSEIEICLPFLKKHIEIVSPSIIVLLGATAMRAVLNLKTGLSQARNQWHEYQCNSGKKIKTMVTFHPSYLLRSPGQKVYAWQDFMMLKNAIQKI